MKFCQLLLFIPRLGGLRRRPHVRIGLQPSGRAVQRVGQLTACVAFQDGTQDDVTVVAQLDTRENETPTRVIVVGDRVDELAVAAEIGIGFEHLCAHVGGMSNREAGSG